MEATPVNIIQYFDGTKQGIIPLFQRPYSWELRDWEALWEDLLGQYDPQGRSRHFMGAIVTLPMRSVPVGVTKHLVIDGQQRLTTISIILCAIREAARAFGDPRTADIIGDLLVNRHHREPDDLKLLPTQADRTTYRRLVYGEAPPRTEETQLARAYRFFLAALSGTDPDGIPLVPSQMLEAIQMSLQVVMISLGESDDPYLIFESLNHKGKPLNQADLVRNYVLMRFQHSSVSGGAQEEVYRSLWRPIEDALGPATTEFLRHYGMRNGDNVRKGDIYAAAKAEFERCVSPEDVREHLGEMRVLSGYYRQFVDPGCSTNAAIGARLRAMRDLDSTVGYPLMLRGFQMVYFGDITESELIEVLDVLESFFVRRLVCNVPTNALNKIMLDLALHLPRQGVRDYVNERLLTGSGSRRWPTDAEFQRAFVEERVYLRRKLAHFVLTALEAAHRHKEPVDATLATVEHVMPQSLSSAWKTELGPRWQSIHEKWLDTFGNLTLTGYNSELGNAPFPVKKERLATTHFEISRDIAAASQWGPEEIQARGRRLGDIALSRWRRG